MSDRLYQRRCRVVVSIPVDTPKDYLNTVTDDIIINDHDTPTGNLLRVAFKITKTLEKEPNTSEITVTNLSASTRARLQKKGVKVTLEAGYQATGVTRIFRGDVRTADPIRDGADWHTKMKVGDGERGFRFARYSQSFAPGTGAGDIIKALANASGLALGNVGTEALNILRTFDAGFSVAGPVAKSLDRVVKAVGYEWSVQDNALQILPRNGVLDILLPEISPSSGLIGSPEMGTPEKKGQPALVKFKALLFPARPGARVKLVSDKYNGFVKIKKVEMSGDTHADDWYTQCEGIISPKS